MFGGLVLKLTLFSRFPAWHLDRIQPSRAPVHNWSWRNRPWERIHLDFTQKGKYIFLVVTDSYSHWPEVVPMSSTTAEKSIEVLRGYFATWVLPDEASCWGGRASLLLARAVSFSAFCWGGELLCFLLGLLPFSFISSFSSFFLFSLSLFSFLFFSSLFVSVWKWLW